MISDDKKTKRGDVTNECGGCYAHLDLVVRFGFFRKGQLQTLGMVLYGFDDLGVRVKASSWFCVVSCLIKGDLDYHKM